MSSDNENPNTNRWILLSLKKSKCLVTMRIQIEGTISYSNKSKGLVWLCYYIDYQPFIEISNILQFYELYILIVKNLIILMIIG